MKYELLLGFFNNKHKYLSRCRLIKLDDNKIEDLSADEVLGILRRGDDIDGIHTVTTNSSRILQTRLLANNGVRIVWDIKLDKSFGVKNSNLINEFDTDKNYPITPFDIGTQSDIKLFWKCKYGHSWEASVGHRIRGDGCPHCNSRSSLPLYEKSLEGWCLDEKNKALKCSLDEYNNAENNIEACSLYRSSNKIVNWVCSKCGKQFSLSPNVRTDGFINTCPYCAKTNYTSKSENIVYKMLLNTYPRLSIQRQKSFSELGKKSFDFL